MDSAIPPDLPGSPLRAEIDRKEDPGMDLQERGSEVDRLKAIESSKGFEEAKEVTAVESRDSKEVSWVKVAQEKKVLRKYDVEILNKDGVHTVEIPDEVLENPTPLWEDFVVGKFLDLAPHVAKVHMVLNRIWKYGDPSTRVEVYKVNSTTMRFKVSSLKAREKILRRGMWNVAGVPMIVSKRSPDTEGEDQKEEAMPMWVHLEKVPLHMYSWEGLSFITSTVGCPVKPHPETLACTNLKEVKIFVRVDVSKPLPKEITFSKEGKQFTVTFYYPWLPSRCKICDKWGHNDVVCGMKSKGKRSVAGTGTPDAKTQGGKDVSTGRGKQEMGEIDKEVKKADSSGSKNEEIVSEYCGQKNGHEGGASGWSLVSPAKTGRSLVLSAQKVDEVVISASKFYVLSTGVMEDGEFLEDVEQAEVDTGTTDPEDLEIVESDDVEDIDQQVVEERKVGLRRGRKAKIPDANPGKSSRPRRKH